MLLVVARDCHHWRDGVKYREFTHGNEQNIARLSIKHDLDLLSFSFSFTPSLSFVHFLNFFVFMLIIFTPFISPVTFATEQRC